MERLKRNLDLIASALIIIVLTIVLYSAVHPYLPWHVEPWETYDITGTHVIVNWYDTEQELNEALDDDTLAGLAECEYRPRFNTSFCELWLVRPTSPEDTYNYDTIGHEFYHTVIGDFHE